MSASMILIANQELEIHETPLERLVYDGSELVVEFDDIHERRVALRFAPCQAVKVTTIDCFSVPTLFVNGRLRRHVLEVVASPWIIALKEELSSHDHHATFLNSAHHFILPFGDNILEVVAWQFTHTDIGMD
jgi:hypothetical protein